MLKGSFTSLHPGRQLLMTLFLSLVGVMVFTIIGILLIPLIYQYSLADLIHSSGGGEALPPQVLKLLQGLSSLGLFLVPAMVAAHLFSFDGPGYLGINRFPKQWLVVIILLILITLSGNSVSDLLYRMSKAIVWPESLAFLEEVIRSSEESSNRQIDAFLKMNTSFDFIQMFLIMAILPAICEEALFRGVLQSIFKSWTRNMHVGIFITAFLFALIHMQFYTFLPIMALGLVLGYVREWTKSLWAPVLIHLINNGSIVVAVYFYNVDYSTANDTDSGLEWGYTVAGLITFALALWGLKFVLTPKQKGPIQEDEALS